MARFRLSVVVGGLLWCHAAAAQSPLFADEFNRLTGLGSAWRVAFGAFSTNGSAALGTRPSSYAFWIGAPPADVGVSALLHPSPSATFVGVVARGDPTSPDRDHYAGFIGPDGAVGVARRTGYVYQILASGPRVSRAAHRLTLTVTGARTVTLSLAVDGVEVLRATDTSSAALSSGLSGIFDYSGVSTPIDAFSVSGTGGPPVFDAARAAAMIDLARRKLERTAQAVSAAQYPKSTRTDGSWTTVPNTDLIGWTQGFFPGSLWYLFEATNDSAWRTRADTWTRNLELQKTNRQTHDLGFKMMSSFGHGYRLTSQSAYRDVLLVSAESLASRYRPLVGVISAADWNPEWRLPLVVDTMMNLELLLWAAQNGGRAEWRDMALSHALKTLAEVVRADGSTFHVVDFEPTTGAIRFKRTFQGYADQSTWARGQAWAVYGFTLVYRYTGDARMLEAARRVTDYYLSRLPPDRIPNWDFDAPNHQKDTSAAAIVSSALLELAQLETDAARAGHYRSEALAMLSSLSSPQYLAPEASQGILAHGVGFLPANQEVDVSLIYGDHYFIEAVRRFQSSAAVPPRIVVRAPNGGESLTPGALTPIEWASFGRVSRVRIELSPDGGATWQTLQASWANDGRFVWTVPAISTTNGRIRVSDASNPLVQDTSDSPFTIAGGPPPPVFRDDFNRTSGLGGSWFIARGAFSTNGSAALGVAPLSYAFWTGLPAAGDSISVTLSTPLRSTHAGLLLRADTALPERDHYAAFVGPDGRLSLARRRGYVYTYLATGPLFPSGSHVLSATASGTNPVVLSVRLDQTEIIRFTDASSSALRNAGRAGIFDYNGAGQPIDAFEVRRP